MPPLLFSSLSLGSFEMCIILKTKAPTDYFGILGLFDRFDLRLISWERVTHARIIIIIIIIIIIPPDVLLAC